MQRTARMKRELQQLEQSPPHGVSCWMKNDSIEQLEARKESLSVSQLV